MPTLQLPDIGHFFDAQDQQNKLDLQEQRRGTVKEAGGLLAQGDATGARNRLFEAGLVNEGLRVEDLQNKRQDRAGQQQKLKFQQEQDVLKNIAQNAVALKDRPEAYKEYVQGLLAKGINVPVKLQDPRNAVEAADAVMSVFQQRQLAAKRQNLESRNQESFGVTPVRRQNPDGTFGTFQLSNRGGARSVDFGGPSIPFKPKTVGTGTGTAVINQFGGETQRVIPKNIAKAEEQKVTGRNIGKLRANLPKLEIGQKLLTSQHKFLSSEIDRALNIIGLDSAGFGTILTSIPTSVAGQLKQRILTIKANIGFDKLQAMREASPTGGALGQVAIQELEALQASLGSLERTQDPQVIKDNLLRIKEVINESTGLRSDLVKNLRRQVTDFDNKQNGKSKPEQTRSELSLSLDAARAAIANGAPRSTVIKRLRDNGIDPAGL